ncbi:MAG: ATP-binding cassette domain-containing protein [Candidatus Euphemobacter frigidus]|nr:ATP-binding cassette domain-containing protein [Candidatus Euphemobacter frigidus]
MSDILIEARDLKKYFPVKRGVLRQTVGYIKAVDGVSLRIERGQTLGLVGETGSGKTTLGRLLLRLLPADGGEVRFAGNDLFNVGTREMKNLRREMQIIFQDPYGSLNPRMRVGDIIAEGLKNFRFGNKNEIKARVAELLEIVGLPPESVRLYPHEFSGGQRQRIGIARAIALNPAFILCDEPVSSLDVSIQAQILNLLSDLQERLGLTYLIIAHDLSVVEHISDWVAVMYRGRIVEAASSRELYRNPAHPYTRALLESIPVPDPSAPPPGTGLEVIAADSSAADSGCLFYPRCPRRMDRCRRSIPVLREFAPDHQVACYLHE